MLVCVGRGQHGSGRLAEGGPQPRSRLPVSGQRAVPGTVAGQSADSAPSDFRSNKGESGKPDGSRSVSSGGGSRRRRGAWRSWRDVGRRRRSGGGRRRRRGERRGSRSVLGPLRPRRWDSGTRRSRGIAGRTHTKHMCVHTRTCTQNFRTLEVGECRNSRKHSL